MSLTAVVGRKPWLGRSLALSLLLLLLGMLSFLVWDGLRQQHEKYDALIEARLNLLAGYKRVAAGRPEIESALAQVEKLDTPRYFLKNTTPSLAAAELQDAAQALFEANGMKVNSVNIAPHKDDDGRRKITLNFSIRGNTEATQKSLYALESHYPYLFVDNLTIRSSVNSGRWQPVPLLEPEVQVQLDLYGYARIGKRK
jgi:general secretion pathway protein M